MVKLLFAEGAALNTKDGWGGTALMIATREGHKGVVELLLANGADINIKDVYGETALMKAIYQGN